MIGPFVRQPGGDPRRLARARRTGCGCGPTARRRAATCASRGRCSSRRWWRSCVAQGQIAVFGLERRARRGGLDHARGDADALRRPRRPDPRHDDLPRDRARPRPRRRARGAVREGEPADADVGVPVRRRARAVRRRPDRVRARATSGAGAIVLLGGLAVAVALQQVGYSWFAFYRARGESWPQAVESAVFGRVVRCCWPCRARCVGGSWGFVAGRAGCTLCVLAARGGLRAAAAAGRAAGRVAAAGRRCRWRSPRRPCWPCGWRCGAGSGRSRRRWGSWRCGSAGLALATARLESGLLAELRGYLRAGATA